MIVQDICLKYISVHWIEFVFLSLGGNLVIFRWRVVIPELMMTMMIIMMVIPELWGQDQPTKSSAKPFRVQNDEVVACFALEVDNLMMMMII